MSSKRTILAAKGKSPSKLLSESYKPFYEACVRVQKLERLSINILEGRKIAEFNEDEKLLFNTLIDLGLMRACQDVAFKQ